MKWKAEAKKIKLKKANSIQLPTHNVLHSALEAQKQWEHHTVKRISSY